MLKNRSKKLFSSWVRGRGKFAFVCLFFGSEGRIQDLAQPGRALYY